MQHQPAHDVSGLCGAALLPLPSRLGMRRKPRMQQYWEDPICLDRPHADVYGLNCCYNRREENCSAR